MQAVTGVTDVAVIPGRYDIEPLLNGNGFVSARIQKSFVDRNIDRNDESFIPQNSLFEAYQKYCYGEPDKATLKECNWQIVFQKIGGLLNHHYVGESRLSMGSKYWQIGFVEKTQSLETLFKNLSSQANDIAEPKSRKPQPEAPDSTRAEPKSRKPQPEAPDSTGAEPKSMEDTAAFKAALKYHKIEKRLGAFVSKVSGEDSQPCPICAETIKKAAKKCIHCGEWIVMEAEKKGPWG